MKEPYKLLIAVFFYKKEKIKIKKTERVYNYEKVDKSNISAKSPPVWR